MKTQLNDARQKEMPKLLIKLGDIDLLLADSPDMVSFGCNIQNYGGSAAFLVGGTYVCWLGQTDESGHQTQDVFPMILPEVLAPGVSCDSEMILFDEDRIVDWTLWNTDDPRMVSVREGEKSICACGFVMYETIFGETWKLGFKRRFTMQSLGDGFTTGGWIRDGNADNYDRMQHVHEPPPKRRWWKVRLSRVKAN